MLVSLYFLLAENCVHVKLGLPLSRSLHLSGQRGTCTLVITNLPCCSWETLTDNYPNVYVCLAFVSRVHNPTAMTFHFMSSLVSLLQLNIHSSLNLLWKHSRWREPVWCAVAGFKYVVFLPETQTYIEQTPRVLMRRPLKYLPEQNTFEELAEEETSALLESWGFARTAAAASESAPNDACLGLVLLLSH